MERKSNIFTWKSLTKVILKKKKKKLDSEHWTLFSTDIRIIQTFVHKER